MKNNSPKKHLILSLGRKGFGEAGLGLRLASELRSAGDQIFVLAHDSNSRLLEGALPHCAFGTEAAPLLQLYISNCLENFQASSIILSDYFTTTLFFECFGLEPDCLTAFGLPIFAIDTWDSTKTSGQIDVLVDEYRHRVLWPGKVKSICPVPFLAPNSDGGFYASLPERVTITKKIRRHLRHTLGMSEDSKAVLFCTAEWQHPNYESHADAAKRCARAIPLLVADYLSRLGETVHLVHVGPQRYHLDATLNGRYHWLPPLAPSEFDTLVAGMDLLVSANISATTIAKAMVFEVPTLVLQNSFSASTAEEVETATARSSSATLTQWLKEALPLFPFSLWPVGYRRFLEPVLRDNPYVAALDIAELLDEERVEAALTALLFDTSARENQKHRQAAYLNQVRSLPTGAQIVHAGIN